MSLAAGAKADMLQPEAGHWGSLLLGKAGWKEKQEGVRQLNNWRIVGCAPHAASEWYGRGGRGGSWGGVAGVLADGRQAAAWPSACTLASGGAAPLEQAPFSLSAASLPRRCSAGPRAGAAAGGGGGGCTRRSMIGLAPLKQPVPLPLHIIVGCSFILAWGHWDHLMPLQDAAPRVCNSDAAKTEWPDLRCSGCGNVCPSPCDAVLPFNRQDTQCMHVILSPASRCVLSICHGLVVVNIGFDPQAERRRERRRRRRRRRQRAALTAAGPRWAGPVSREMHGQKRSTPSSAGVIMPLPRAECCYSGRSERI